MTMPEMRAFIAIAVDPSILARLTSVQQHLRQTGAEVGWVRPEGMHITLKFLGNIHATHVTAIGEMLTDVAQRRAPFRIAVAGTGAFPTLQRPRVIWAGITEGATELFALARAVEDGAGQLGLPREERPYHPHLTLGRVKSQKNVAHLTALVHQYAHEQFGEMRATSIILMQSELLPDGARYTPLRHVFFGG